MQINIFLYYKHLLRGKFKNRSKLQRFLGYRIKKAKESKGMSLQYYLNVDLVWKPTEVYWAKVKWYARYGHVKKIILLLFCKYFYIHSHCSVLHSTAQASSHTTIIEFSHAQKDTVCCCFVYNKNMSFYSIS
jgi:hypothetical protein